MSLVEHKKARFNYEFLETYEAGIELEGFEVKALRNHQGSLEGAHVVVRGGEAFLVGATIPPYQQNNTPLGYDPSRTRRLLLSKKEISAIGNEESKKGLTVVPISVYNKGRNIKVEVAIARGKKQYDKRETLKKREADRKIERELKSQR